MGARWNRFMDHGVRREARLAWLNGAYFKAVEAQRRGALHLHVLVRVPAGTEVTSQMVEDLADAAVRYGFGHVVDVEPVESHRAAGYVAKYVSKGSNDRPSVPWSREHATFGRLRSSATYRTWSASRSWPWSMAQLRADRAHYAELLTGLPAWGPVEVVGWPVSAFFDPLPDRPDLWCPVTGLRRAALLGL